MGEHYTDIRDSQVKQGDLVLMIDQSFTHPHLFEFQRIDVGVHSKDKVAIGKPGYELRETRVMAGITIPSLPPKANTYNGQEGHYPLTADAIYVGLEHIVQGLEQNPSLKPYIDYAKILPHLSVTETQEVIPST